MIAGFVSAISRSVLPSCKKDDGRNLSEPPAKDSVVTPVDSNKIRMARFVGVWKTHEEGWDYNRNGEWDDEERRGVSNSDMGLLTFNADSTASAYYESDTITVLLRWHLLDAGQTLCIGPHEGQRLNVVTISDSLLILRDTSGGIGIYLSYKR